MWNNALLTLIAQSSALRVGACGTPNSSQHHGQDSGMGVGELTCSAFLPTPYLGPWEATILCLQEWIWLWEFRYKCRADTNVDHDKWKYFEALQPSGPADIVTIPQITVQRWTHSIESINIYRNTVPQKPGKLNTKLKEERDHSWWSTQKNSG